eukprot:TRINITY_DN121183_c0_g1_i1.p1 TRINITY_DN121183_c0_g1~~TRINITY_DN121183_c0_g1_i1.p1  ORF type:complete len:402 (-),score=48.42 TRINITY_DN121183_c0_g1_i1:552-1757(-)
MTTKRSLGATWLPLGWACILNVLCGCLFAEARRAPQSKYYILHPPEEVKAEIDVGFPLTCRDFGHMYSFETYFPEFLEENPHFLADTPEEADWILLPHCVTYVYHMYRYRYGYGDTVEGCWQALELAQTKYLLPLISWAKEHPVHERTNGSNFLIIYSMDKGRVDYPIASNETVNWRALTTVGNGSMWLSETQPFIAPSGLYAQWDRCLGTVEKKRKFIWQAQDVVLPVPMTFEWTERSSMRDNIARPQLMFFAGTPNSCLRRFICESFANATDPDIMVRSHALPREQFEEQMYSSRFCLVPDGFSAISARMYEVMAHGCVPAIISEAFHPPFEGIVDWRRFALFIRPGEVPYAAQILRGISDLHYLSLHGNLEAVSSMFDMTKNDFWATTLYAIEGSRDT